MAGWTDLCDSAFASAFAREEILDHPPCSRKWHTTKEAHSKLAVTYSQSLQLPAACEAHNAELKADSNLGKCFSTALNPVKANKRHSCCPDNGNGIFDAQVEVPCRSTGSSGENRCSFSLLPVCSVQGNTHNHPWSVHFKKVWPNSLIFLLAWFRSLMFLITVVPVLPVKLQVLVN